MAARSDEGVSPLRTSAPEITKTEHSTTMTSLAKPENACAGVRMPVTTSAASKLIVMTSIEMRSRKNATITAASNDRTTKIS